jgi:hypothetical protein
MQKNRAWQQRGFLHPAHPAATSAARFNVS